MRIKVLACAAALAAGAFTSMAQSNVYSLNVVGYINIPLVDGFNLVANQLDLDGTGNNNFVSSVFSNNLPLNSRVYIYSPASSSYSFASYVKPKGGTTGAWSSDLPWNPGQGAWVSIPANSFGTGVTGSVVTVGQVLQGSLSNTNIPTAGGYNIVASQIPLAGGLTSVLGYQPQVNERAYIYDPVALTYSFDSYVKPKGGTTPAWTPAEPQFQVGQGFWMEFVAGSSWKTNFTVGP